MRKQVKLTNHAVILCGALALGCKGTVGVVRAAEKPPLPDLNQGGKKDDNHDWLLKCGIAMNRILLIPVGWMLIVCGSGAIAVAGEPLGTVPPGALVLDQDWQMQSSAVNGDDGAKLSQPGKLGGTWYQTDVPTTVLSALIRHGVYPDPYVGTNNMLIPDANDAHNKRFDLARFSHLPDKSNPWAKPWWFRREFQVPGDYRDKVVWLNLDGINYRADVWLNGKQIGNAKNIAGMFKRHRLDITSHIQLGKSNALAIRIHPVDHPGDPVHEQLDGINGSLGPNGGDDAMARNVSQICAVGWDWVPAARDRNMGLWQNVWLEGTGPVAVRDPAAFTEVRLPEGDAAAVTLRLHLENAAAREQKVELTARIKPDGFSAAAIEVTTNVTLAAGSLTEIILKPDEYPQLIMNHPRLWWPVTYGEQPLYRLSVEARVDGRVSNRAERLFGVRKVGSFILPGGGRAFTVNGRTLRLTGGAWIPDFLMGWDAQRYRDEIRLMAEGNHTVVRVNGCGIVPPDVFFDTCDRLGVMVWEDLMRTSIESSNSYNGRKWGTPADCDEPALWLENMRDCVLRLRGHPSVLVWCGGNEDPPPKYLGVPMQDKILPELDGTRPWLPSSSVEPDWAKESMQVWSGGPWNMLRLPAYFKLYATEDKCRALDEIGLVSMPPMNSVARFLPDYNQPDPATPPFNRTMSYHDAADGNCGIRDTDKIIRKDLGEPVCLSDYLSMGDLYNGLAYRAIFEAANKARPRNAGTHLWKTNAAWPSFLWQVYDWYLRPNAGYYSMKSACRPLHVQHSADDHSLQLVSTLPEARSNLTLRITVADMSGAIEHREERTVAVPADATVSLGDLPLLKQDEKLRFLVLELVDANGRELDRSATFVQRDCRYHELLALPPAAVTARVLKRIEEGDETVVQLTVQNTSGIPAVNVWLEVLKGPQGEEVLPGFWNENALLLLPREERHLTVRFRTKDLHDQPPHLMVEGWNVLPAETDMASGKKAPLQLKVNHSEVVGKNGAVCVKFSGSPAGITGERWTAWPVPVRVDGQLLRYVRLAVKSGSPMDAQVTLTNLPAGTHRVAVGDSPDQTITIPVASSSQISK